MGPGPGSYEYVPRTASAPKFSSRNVDLAHEYKKQIPGPGSYSPEKKSEAPKYSLYSKRKEEVDN